MSRRICFAFFFPNAGTPSIVFRSCAAVALFLFVLGMSGCNKSKQSSIDVNGTVLYGNVPVAGVAVAIPGVGTTTTADDGSFTFSQVMPPYDIAVSLPSYDSAMFFKSVRSATPRLGMLRSPDPIHKATISSPESNPPGDVCPTLEDASAALAGASSASGSPGYSAQSLSWFGPETVSAALYGLAFSHDAGKTLPTGDFKYKKTSLTLEDGKLLTTQPLELEAVEAATLTGTITVPDGYTLSGKRLFLACLDLVYDDTETTSFSYVTPKVLETTLQLSVTASNDEGASVYAKRHLVPDASDVSIVLPASPTISSPADGATLVDSATVFSWSEVAGATYFVAFYLPDGAGPFPAIVTTATSITLPDPAVVGMSSIPKGTELEWDVMAVVSLTMDDVVSSGFLGLDRDTYMATSQRRKVTTAP